MTTADYLVADVHLRYGDRTGRRIRRAMAATSRRERHFIRRLGVGRIALVAVLSSVLAFLRDVKRAFPTAMTVGKWE